MPEVAHPLQLTLKSCFAMSCAHAPTEFMGSCSHLDQYNTPSIPRGSDSPAPTQKTVIDNAH